MSTSTSTSASAKVLERVVVLIGVASLLAACSADRKAGQAPPPATPASTPAGYPGQPPAAPSAGKAPADSDSATKAQPPAPPTEPATGEHFAPPPNRAAAMSQATNEVESSQRELDVAGGDCRNACRALGSMDRATGRLCNLAQSNDEVRRCGDAKMRVYSARDRVRNTCGQCADTSVDRNAPIPSR